MTGGPEVGDPTSHSAAVDGETKGPWVETPEGELFFINALLVAPELFVLFPLSMKLAFSGLGLVQGESLYFDTFPILAAHVLPYVGWLLVIPLWTTVRNLRMGVEGWPRIALVGFLLSHLGFLGFTVWSWLGGAPALLPS